MRKKIDISIIIPAYNSEKTIDKLFSSIINQSFNGNIECILLDDNSIDNTIQKAEDFRSEFDKRGWDLRILFDGKNKKQGARRNQGIQTAKGAYVLFVDSDDFIHSKTLELTYGAAKSGPLIDMVYFNYAMYSADAEKKYKFSPRVNNYIFSDGDTLMGSSCEKILNTDSFFTVNKLYRRDFLLSNDILFGEGYFYEDLEFYFHSAQYANTIKLLPNVLYYVRVHSESTTKSYSDSTIHLDSYLQAIKASYNKLNLRGKYSKYHILKYLVNRLLLYTEKRLIAPDSIKKEYLNKAFKYLYLKNEDTTFPDPRCYASNLYYMIFGLNLFQKKKFSMIEKVYKIYLNNPKLLVKIKQAQLANNSFIGSKVNKLLYQPTLTINAEVLRYKITNPERKLPHTSQKSEKYFSSNLKNKILMLGFDYRYVGNSKYLFDYLSSKYDSDSLKFVTDDYHVPENYRIKPHSDEFYAYLDKSKVIIAESWIPLDYSFYDNQKIIQLWHGTPLKKVLYDSPEREVIRSNKHHKTKKMYDINRWDVLISDSKNASKKFLSAYSIENGLIAEIGYPRNNWLVEHQSDKNLKTILKHQLGIPEDKKVITYLPTWRDYNFRSTSTNNGYILNKKRFIEHLDSAFDFVFLEKVHDLTEASHDDKFNTIYIPSNEDIQPYLLISDIVISDYSSVIFDCLYINLPFFLLYKDYDYYVNGNIKM